MDAVPNADGSLLVSELQRRGINRAVSESVVEEHLKNKAVKQGVQITEKLKPKKGEEGQASMPKAVIRVKKPQGKPEEVINY